MIDIPDFTNSKVLIIGDIMLDRYWHGATARISPEAPVPIVHVNKTQELPGGAGNVALNIRSIGSEAFLMGITGDDNAADSLREKLAAFGVKTYLHRELTMPTVTKLRVMSQHQQLIRLDFETKIPSANKEALLRQFQHMLQEIHVLILSDYGKGTLSEPQPFIRAARDKGIPVLVDPKGTHFSRYHGATILTPNRKEFETLVGHCHTEDELVDKGHQLMKQHDLSALLITRGEQGITLLQLEKKPLHLPARTREVFDVTGAGDTVIALLAASIAVGMNLEEATALANLAASIVVTKMGAANVTTTELRHALENTDERHYNILTEKQLKRARAEAHRRGETVVMTNGCFDLLHVGHIAYLKQAKALGHKLCIAVNDDDSVRKLKGPRRPITPLQQRMEMLAALKSVDWVVPFSEDTPERLISEVLPDILVKGGDYKASEIAGAESVIKNGGEVKILDYIAGCSTSNLIENILEVTE